jgi:hypothetical protein
MAAKGGPDTGLGPVRLDLPRHVVVWAPRVLSGVDLTPRGAVSGEGIDASGHFLGVSVFALT